MAYVEAGVSGIYLVDLNAEGLAEVAEQCEILSTSFDFQVLTAVVDVTNEEMVKKMVSEAKAVFGRIDYAANIAGV